MKDANLDIIMQLPGHMTYLLPPPHVYLERTKKFNWGVFTLICSWKSFALLSDIIQHFDISFGFHAKQFYVGQCVCVHAYVGVCMCSYFYSFMSVDDLTGIMDSYDIICSSSSWIWKSCLSVHWFRSYQMTAATRTIPVTS